MLRLVGLLLPGPSGQVNDSIDGGRFSIGLRMKGLGTSADVKDVWAGLYGLGAKNESADGKWGVMSELLDDETKLDSASLSFPNSYVSGDTWVSGDKGVYLRCRL